MMTKKMMLSLLLVFPFVTTSGFAADKDNDPWVAKNPYAGKTYQKEEVSYFAQGINKLTTVAVGTAVIGYGVYHAYTNWHTAPWEIALPGAASYATSLSIPTASSFGHTGLAWTAVTFLGFPGTVLATYVSKKAAQGFEFVAKHGWKYVSYGLHTLNYYWGDLRARHLQGTLFANHHVKYEKLK